MKRGLFSLPTVSFRRIYLIAFFNIFLILFTFVLTLPKFVSQPGLSIRLPRVISAEPVRFQDIVISIDRNNMLYLNGVAYEAEALTRQLRAAHIEGRQALIKVDQDAEVGVLVSVWDLLRQCGVVKVSIVTNG